MLSPGCGGKGGSQGDPVAGRVGPAGGNVTDPSGATLDIPAEALDGWVDFTITSSPPEASPVAGLVLATHLFEVGPHGTVFAIPATLTLPLDAGADVAATPQYVVYGSPDKENWEPLPTTLGEGVLRAEVAHLSWFVGLLDDASQCVPIGGECHTSGACCEIPPEGDPTCGQPGVTCGDGPFCVDGVCSTDCAAPGGGCTNQTDCCDAKTFETDGQVCLGGVCQSCMAKGTKGCDTFSCCAGLSCYFGVCDDCEQPGIACDDDVDCCNGDCGDDNLCAGCPKAGDACTTSEDCCWGSCCFYTGGLECSEAGVCTSCSFLAMDCQETTECCAGEVCYKGKCEDCIPEWGSGCLQDADCCNDGYCAPEGICYDCVIENDWCTSDDQCCTGRCWKEDGAEKGTCQGCHVPESVDPCGEAPDECCDGYTCTPEGCAECDAVGAPCAPPGSGPGESSCCGFMFCTSDGICAYECKTDEDCAPYCVNSLEVKKQVCDPAAGLCTDSDEEPEDCDYFDQICKDGACFGECTPETENADCPAKCQEGTEVLLSGECVDLVCKYGPKADCTLSGQQCFDGSCISPCDTDTPLESCPPTCASLDTVQLSICASGTCEALSTEPCDPGEMCQDGTCIFPCDTDNECPSVCDSSGDYAIAQVCNAAGACEDGPLSNCTSTGDTCLNGECVPTCTPQTVAADCGPKTCDGPAWYNTWTCTNGACDQELEPCPGTSQCQEGECVPVCTDQSVASLCPPKCQGTVMLTATCVEGACLWSETACDGPGQSCSEATGMCITACTPMNKEDVCPPSKCSDDGTQAMAMTCVWQQCGHAPPQDCAAQGKTCVDGACVAACTPATVETDCPSFCQGDFVVSASCIDGACQWSQNLDCGQTNMFCEAGKCVDCASLGNWCGGIGDPPCCGYLQQICIDGKCAEAPIKMYTDPTSGLMWEAVLGLDVPTDLPEAIAYCDSLTLGGHGDWRVPTISELRSLIRGCPNSVSGGPCGISDQVTEWVVLNETCWTCPFSEGPAANGCYWPDEIQDTECDMRSFMSTTHCTNENLGPNEIFAVRFHTGSLGYFNLTTSDAGAGRVRCVR